MDAKKALEYFKNGYDNLRTYQLTHSPTPGMAILAPVYTAAIEALKKQVPQKPNEIRDVGNTIKYKDGYCSCGNEVCSGIRYCSDCGQRLDWSSVKNNKE